MIRKNMAWVLATLVALSTGCMMYDGAYDYCGPLYTGDCGQTCNPMARAHSVLSPTFEPTASHEVISEESPTPASEDFKES
jgi:hypothetical protein